jgi:hypothetical protein
LRCGGEADARNERSKSSARPQRKAIDGGCGLRGRRREDTAKESEAAAMRRQAPEKRRGRLGMRMRRRSGCRGGTAWPRRRSGGRREGRRCGGGAWGVQRHCVVGSRRF